MLRMHHQMTKMNIFKHYFVTITIIVLPILIIPATSNPTYDDYLSDFDIYPGNFNKDDADILLHMAGFIAGVSCRPDDYTSSEFFLYYYLIYYYTIIHLFCLVKSFLKYLIIIVEPEGLTSSIFCINYPSLKALKAVLIL
ncbi:uncharacterized protein LOC132923082 isoform X1 [Rhopalosiphum padi]|uniref:uncharacterized protein LOC132923082 isoform X1 n=1 Tax=Rhopalosiphum padi TaxID=40932 RepID=UPI00298E7281|nr:uncharacterized protein LOC132923082 isoform X1 [Rhopalosiphum padi]